MTESQIQKATIKAIKATHKCKIIANPLSEMQLHYKSERAKQAALAKARAQGWEAGQPDLTVILKGHTVAIELKTPATNPFRPFNRKKDVLWIEASTDHNKTEHVTNQLKYLAELYTLGVAPFVCWSVDQSLAAIKAAITGDYSQFTLYTFSYGWDSGLQVYYAKS